MMSTVWRTLPVQPGYLQFKNVLVEQHEQLVQAYQFPAQSWQDLPGILSPAHTACWHAQEEYSRIDLTVVCADGSETVIPGTPPP